MDETKAKILGDFYTLRAGISYISREKSKAQKLIKKNDDYVQKERTALYAMPAAKYDEVKEVLNLAENPKISCEETCNALTDIANNEIIFANEQVKKQKSYLGKAKNLKIIRAFFTALVVLSALAIVAHLALSAYPVVLYYINHPVDYQNIIAYDGGTLVLIVCGSVFVGSLILTIILARIDSGVSIGFAIFFGIAGFISLLLTLYGFHFAIKPIMSTGRYFWIPLGILAGLVALLVVFLIIRWVFGEKSFNWTVKKMKSEKECQDSEQFRKDVLALSSHYKTYTQNVRQNTEETYKAVIPAVQTCKTLYDALVEQYSSLLDVRDWEFLDFFIYYFETNRADTVREALLLADNERRADRIVQAVQSAAREISHTLNRGFEALGSQISLSFNALSDRIDNLSYGINQISGGLNAINGNLITMSAMNSALIAKANTDSRQLMDDVHQMRVLADNAEVRRRTT